MLLLFCGYFFWSSASCSLLFHVPLSCLPLVFSESLRFTGTKGKGMVFDRQPHSCRERKLWALTPPKSTENCVSGVHEGILNPLNVCRPFTTRNRAARVCCAGQHETLRKRTLTCKSPCHTHGHTSLYATAPLLNSS